MITSRLFRSIAVVGVFALGACSSGGGTSDPEEGITLNVSVSSLSIAQGASGTVVATISRSGGYAGAVEITVENLPANVTISANPVSIPSSGTSSTITFNVGAGATATTTTVTVRANGSGVVSQTQTVSLTVTSSSAAGYRFSLSQSALSIQQSNQAQTTLTLNRTGGFAGNVTFSATGVPNLMTVTFNPTQTTGNTTTVTVAAGAGLAAQAYPITLKGTATGLADVTIPLNVTVTAQGGGGGSTTFRVCNQVMLFAAYQDGTGPWTVATIGNNGSTATFNLASGRGGVAYVFSNNVNSYSTVYMYGTQAELNSGAGTCVQAPAGKTVTGSVANVGLSDIALISLGISSGGSVIGALGLPNFTLSNVPNGPVDLIATRNVFDIGTQTQTSNKIIVRRDQNPASGAILPVLDFNAEGVAPVSKNLTVNNRGSDLVALSVTFGSNVLNAASSVVSIYSNILGSNSNVIAHPTHPSAGPNDMHGYSLFTIPVAGAFRTLVATYREGLDRQVTLGQPLGSVIVVTAATAPSPRFRLTYTRQADYTRGWSANYSQTGGATNRFQNVSITPGYQGATATIDHTIPDLSGLTGWNAIWNFVTGQEVDWGFTATGGQATGVDGGVAVQAARSGTITP